MIGLVPRRDVWKKHEISIKETKFSNEEAAWGFIEHARIGCAGVALSLQTYIYLCVYSVSIFFLYISVALIFNFRGPHQDLSSFALKLYDTDTSLSFNHQKYRYIDFFTFKTDFVSKF